MTNSYAIKTVKSSHVICIQSRHSVSTRQQFYRLKLPRSENNLGSSWYQSWLAVYMECDIVWWFNQHRLLAQMIQWKHLYHRMCTKVFSFTSITLFIQIVQHNSQRLKKQCSVPICMHRGSGPYCGQLYKHFLQNKNDHAGVIHIA